MTVEGKDLNLNLMISGMFTLSLLVYFAIEFSWIWIVIGFGIALLYFHWKTTKFKITIDSNTICFQKETLGIKLLKRSFSYDNATSEGGDIVFKKDKDYLKVHFERETFDTVELEVNSKFYPIGTEQNAVEIMNALRKKLTPITKASLRPKDEQ